MPTLRRLLADAEFIGSRTTRALAALLLLLGAAVAVGGLAYAANGASQAPANVIVPVTLTSARTTLEVTGAELPDGAWLEPAGGDLALVDMTGVSRWTGFLARGDVALGGLAVGLGAILLAPVLTSVAEGEPFRRGNAARLGGTAGVIMLAGTLAPLLPQVAAIQVLDHLGLVAPGSPFVVGLGADLAPIGVGTLVLVLAEAFRRGAQIADDTRGLV